MEHDLKRYPRLLAKLLTGQPLPLDCSVQGCISVWDSAHLGRRPSRPHLATHAYFSSMPFSCAIWWCASYHLMSVPGILPQSISQHDGMQDY